MSQPAICSGDHCNRSAIAAYLEAAGHGDDKAAPLFHPVSNNARGADRPITPDGVYKVLARYAGMVGIDVDGFGPHALARRCTPPIYAALRAVL